MIYEVLWKYGVETREVTGIIEPDIDFHHVFQRVIGQIQDVLIEVTMRLAIANLMVRLLLSRFVRQKSTQGDYLKAKFAALAAE